MVSQKRWLDILVTLLTYGLPGDSARTRLFQALPQSLDKEKKDPFMHNKVGVHHQFLLPRGRIWGVTNVGHNMSVPLHLNADVPEQNYHEKADAARVADFHDCMESPGCILSDQLCVI